MAVKGSLISLMQIGENGISPVMTSLCKVQQGASLHHMILQADILC